jgi:hypothetical protein
MHKNQKRDLLIIFCFLCVVMGACHNSFFGRNAQIPNSKCLIWKGFGTGLGWRCLRKSHNYVLPKPVPNPILWLVFFRFWWCILKIYGTIIWIALLHLTVNSSLCSPWSTLPLWTTQTGVGIVSECWPWFSASSGIITVFVSTNTC